VSDPGTTSADQTSDDPTDLDFPGSGGEPGAPQPDQAEGEPEDVEG
jgi:hypothetical protein